jgi:hypothetical protein
MNVSLFPKQALVFFCLIPFFFLSTSCAYGPQTEKKLKLNYLSGEHYEGKGPTMTDVSKIKALPEAVAIPELEAVPLIYKRKQVPTVISGTVMVSEFKPLKFKPLLLIQGDKTILKTKTDNHGAFKFSGSLLNGEYKIIVDTESHEGEKNIVVDTYVIEHVNMSVHEKPVK